MDARVRHLLTFEAAGLTLAATLDDGPAAAGLLMVTGGTQTRIGSHRMFERLSPALASSGHPCFRFDRRGVGDSEGEDQGFRGSSDDLQAAAGAFRAHVPGLKRVIGFGLCDGATALMLFGGAARLDGLILVNPWLVEAEAGAPPPAAIRHLYVRRLTSREGWRRLLSGRVSFRKVAGGLRRAADPACSDLGREALGALADAGIPARLILARDDATAIAAERVWRNGRQVAPAYVETDSHTFARSGDMEALRAAVMIALAELGGK
jgi:exosortase A-associated hydrolase 1